MLIVLGAWYLAQTVDARHAALFVVTLVAFGAGSVIATAHMPFWTSLPQWQPVSLVKTLGLAPALLLNWAVFALIAAVTVVVEKHRHGRLVKATLRAAQASPWLHGPWPLVTGALALVVLNFATLALAAPVSHDVTSVMDIGIVLGAMLAAALAGRWHTPRARVSPATSPSGSS